MECPTMHTPEPGGCGSGHPAQFPQEGDPVRDEGVYFFRWQPNSVPSPFHLRRAYPERHRGDVGGIGESTWE